MTAFADRLLDWFDQHGRKDLPWQIDRSPYRVWVSEIMLQQTQVSTVIPYFERFMQRFPDLEYLAQASLDEVLHQWTGLGYYARARNLHKSANQVMKEWNGDLPMDSDLLQQLPGIGRSTANAIIAQCADRPAAILDGNVKRVLARCFAVEGWPGQSATAKQLWALSESLVPDRRAADYTQAIMDLGATICLRSNPLCEACPMTYTCEARATNRIAAFPAKKPRKVLPVRETVMLYIEADGEVLLEQRPPTGLWGGLWSLPECTQDEVANKLQALGLHATSMEALESFRHSFTHYHLDISPLHVRARLQPPGIAGDDRLRWVDPANPDEVGLSRPAAKLLAALGTSEPQGQVVGTSGA